MLVKYFLAKLLGSRSAAHADASQIQQQETPYPDFNRLKGYQACIACLPLCDAAKGRAILHVEREDDPVAAKLRANGSKGLRSGNRLQPCDNRVYLRRRQSAGIAEFADAYVDP